MFGEDKVVLKEADPQLVERAFGRIKIYQGCGEVFRRQGSLLQERNPTSYAVIAFSPRPRMYV